MWPVALFSLSASSLPVTMRPWHFADVRYFQRPHKARRLLGMLSQVIEWGMPVMEPLDQEQVLVTELGSCGLASEPFCCVSYVAGCHPSWQY